MLLGVAGQIEGRSISCSGRVYSGGDDGRNGGTCWEASR